MKNLMCLTCFVCAVCFVCPVIILCSSTPGVCGEDNLTSLSITRLSLKQSQDAESIRIYRNGLESIIRYIGRRNDLFPREKIKHKRLLRKALREDALATWKTLLDYYMALDSVAAFHKDFFKIKDKSAREVSYSISRAALYTQYRFAIDFIAAAEKNPALDTLFNEAVPGLGLPGGVYKTFKYRFLNVKMAGEFAAFEAVASYFGKNTGGELRKWVELDRKKIWQAGKSKGLVLTFRNGLHILTQKSHQAWFPIQKGISNWMGNTKVYRKNKYLIQPAQIKKYQSLLKPGDILLERREWYLTNVGIPGFWSHAALYIGTPEERQKIFTDTDTLNWVGRQNETEFEDLLKNQFPEAYKQSLIPFKDNTPPRVIEAIAKGVVFTSLEYSASCDSLAVLRPRLSNKEIAMAIFRAFRYWGRPYDYNFDFLTENSLVCSELVYKVYEPGKHSKGLSLPLEKILDHMVTPVNAFARQFARNFGTDGQQTDLILFLDGFEKSKTAKPSDLAAFMKSWKRPKWHILVHR